MKHRCVTVFDMSISTIGGVVAFAAIAEREIIE
jgi:hypothetical protein